MLDLDGFKAFNDRQGHPAGDLRLIEVARAITSAVRATDRPYRYGGDEFAVLLPSTPRDIGTLVARRITDAIAALDTGGCAPVTMSIGAASHPDDATTRDDLVAAADGALYQAKASGGNQVATLEVASGGVAAR
jgi:diguanylate cyclase (GGDEF)-like protein